MSGQPGSVHTVQSVAIIVVPGDPTSAPVGRPINSSAAPVDPVGPDPSQVSHQPLPQAGGDLPASTGSGLCGSPRCSSTRATPLTLLRWPLLHAYTEITAWFTSHFPSYMSQALFEHWRGEDPGPYVVLFGSVEGIDLPGPDQSAQNPKDWSCCLNIMLFLVPTISVGDDSY